MMLVWIVVGIAVGVAVPTPGYCGKHRMGWAQRWEAIHPALPWQRLRRRIAAARRAARRPGAQGVRVAVPASRHRAEDLSWAWWQQRREAYKPVLTAAGAW
jgi:hypothetical protein